MSDVEKELNLEFDPLEDQHLIPIKQPDDEDNEEEKEGEINRLLLNW